MPRTRLVLSVLLGLSLAMGPAHGAMAEDFVRDPAVLIDHGVICQISSEGSRPAPDTMVGQINLIEQTRDLDVTTQLVPATAGISFGIKFMLAPGAGTREATVIVTHPPMGEAGITRETWLSTVDEFSPSLNLFTFEFPYEMVPGPWVMALELDGERVLEQSFEVVSELAAPAVLSVCYGQDFVS
ncbi:hypothetical protein GCM10011415_12020 [Salipiger pallidus]|uniref:DUF3859 domain-containing protein n=1 Tax=Salipiger pallidus TaxID=1775170 RepID=A0A8J3EEY3_9RHOB|nr:DUF3859 domain-containing protein [Salipiger pallidus]GGG66752.1 hypothetical protein GCM10011415_12020 [Salipiger pallidus]